MDFGKKHLKISLSIQCCCTWYDVHTVYLSIQCRCTWVRRREHVGFGTRWIKVCLYNVVYSCQKTWSVDMVDWTKLKRIKSMFIYIMLLCSSVSLCRRFPLYCANIVYSEIAFYTMYFVLSYSIDGVSILSYLLFEVLTAIYAKPQCVCLKRQLLRNKMTLGLYSLCCKTSYCQISWSLEAARLGDIIIAPLWNLAGTSAALLSMGLSNFRAIGKV